METLDEKFRKSIQRLKAYEINKLRKLEKEQKAFFQEIREKVEKEITEKKSMDDLLSPKQVTDELKISRKTFDRWVKNGLNILQKTSGTSVRVKRKDMETYLSEKYNVR